MKRKPNLKMLLQLVLVTSLMVLTTAESSYRSQPTNEPKEQGRTLGLFRPLLGLGLGLSSLARPLTGYDSPYVPAYRPSSGSGPTQLDPYYGYGNHASYRPNYYNGYNYYGGYPLYRPAFPFYNAYRPQFYPAYYGGNAQSNGFGGQRPVYSNSRPTPIPQRPIAGQQPASYPAVAPAAATTGGTTPSVANSAQAAQIANLLGQLLGQQLRPLLNPAAAAPAHDDPGIAPSNYEAKTSTVRYYRG